MKYLIATLSAVALLAGARSASAAPEDQPEESKKTANQTPSLPGQGILRSPERGEFELHERLVKWEERLQRQEAEQEEARVEIKEATDALEAKISQLTSLLNDQKALAERIENALEQVKDQRMLRLIEVTGKMPPKKAARYLAGLDDMVAASILDGMKSRKAAKIMAALPPTRAQALSRKYLNNDEFKRTRALNAERARKAERERQRR